jgi:8-oxo-dGTP pyrophosphatase MutT (NUDIX family)
MKIKKCVGVLIYNKEDKIFLMMSPKWRGWIVPGGEIKKDETEEEALRREIKEELGIEINNILKLGEKIKHPSSDFKDNKVKFVFIDFFAKTLQTKIIPNEEISDYNWFTVEEALKLPLLDSTRNLINQYIKAYKLI